MREYCTSGLCGGLSVSTGADTLELVECGLFLVESAVFSAKLLPSLRGLLKPLLGDAEGPHYTRAQALMSRINDAAGK